MAKVYKHKNPHIKTITLLFSVRILCGVIPFALLIFFLVNINDLQVREELWLMFTLAAILVLFGLVSRRYNVLVSGYTGERKLLKIARRMPGNQICFMNLPLQHKSRRTEIDMLAVSPHGITIIEVKNHSGLIEGRENDYHWLHEKTFYENGKKKIETKFMNNPFRQLIRQRLILKSILLENGIDVLVDSILYFSNPAAKLKIQHGSDCYVASSESEMLRFMKNKTRKPAIGNDAFIKIKNLLK